MKCNNVNIFGLPDTDICPRYPWLKNIVGKNAQTKMLIAKNNGSVNMDSWIHTMGLHVLTVCCV